MVGETISHYRISKKLGSGGMGIVYQAYDTRLERWVDIKLMPAKSWKKRFSVICSKLFQKLGTGTRKPR